MDSRECSQVQYPPPSPHTHKKKSKMLVKIKNDNPDRVTIIDILMPSSYHDMLESQAGLSNFISGLVRFVFW